MHHTLLFHQLDVKPADSVGFESRIPTPGSGASLAACGWLRPSAARRSCFATLTAYNESMTLNNAVDQPRDKGKFDFKRGSQPEASVDLSAHKKAVRDAAFDAMYAADDARLSELATELEGYGEQLDVEKLKERADRSHAVLAFDRNWNTEHGIGRHSDAREYDKAVRREFGFGEVRFHQILVNNPEFRAKVAEMEAEGADTSTVRERMYPDAKVNPARYETKHVTQGRFDEWEVKNERERGVR